MLNCHVDHVPSAVPKKYGMSTVTSARGGTESGGVHVLRKA